MASTPPSSRSPVGAAFTREQTPKSNGPKSNGSGSKSSGNGSKSSDTKPKTVSLKELTDEDVLLALLQHPSDLTSTEQKAFDGWLHRLQEDMLFKLSAEQRDWARGKFRALNLGEGFNRDNLANAASVTGRKVDYNRPGALDAAMGPRVLAPPPSRRRSDV